MTYDNTDERGEDAVARQRGGSEPDPMLIASHASDCDLIAKRPFAMLRGHVCTCGAMGGSEPGHLPECWATDQIDTMEPLCICDRLRAREARVRIDWEMSNGPAFDFARGYAAALAEARDAVVSQHGRLSREDAGGFCDALTAIDALRATP